MTLQNVFLIDGRRGRQVSLLLVAAAVILNGLVLFNAIWHDPRTGYDVAAHLTNAMVLSEGRLPTRSDGIEYFSPPLPYAPAAGAMALIRWLGQEGRQTALVTIKVGQTFNVFWSLLLTWGLLSIGQRLERSAPLAAGSEAGPSWGDGRVRLAALGLILLLPVYFKSFAMMRGEPAMAALMVLAVDQIARCVEQRRYGPWRGVGLGVTLGLLILARQWGVFFYPAALLAAWAAWRKERLPGPASHRRAVLAMALCAIVTASLVGGWFYLWLRHTEGSVIAYIHPARPFSLANHPASFYLDPALPELVTHPTRPAFPQRFIPIFWSDLWGDYWGYWVVWAYDARPDHGWYFDGRQFQDILEMIRQHTGQDVITPRMLPSWLRSNYFDIGPYLGRANILGAPVALVLLVSLARACGPAWRFLRRPAGPASADGLVPMLALVTLLATGTGYAVFLIRMSLINEGVLIKPTYVLAAMVLTACPWGLWWSRAWREHPTAARWLALVLLGVGLHNAPLLVTRFLRFWT